jgi:hypothetical protein
MKMRMRCASVIYRGVGEEGGLSGCVKRACQASKWLQCYC